MEVGLKRVLFQIMKDPALSCLSKRRLNLLKVVFHKQTNNHACAPSTRSWMTHRPSSDSLERVSQSCCCPPSPASSSSPSRPGRRSPHRNPAHMNNTCHQPGRLHKPCSISLQNIRHTTQQATFQETFRRDQRRQPNTQTCATCFERKSGVNPSIALLFGVARCCRYECERTWHPVEI